MRKQRNQPTGAETMTKSVTELARHYHNLIADKLAASDLHPRYSSLRVVNESIIGARCTIEFSVSVRIPKEFLPTASGSNTVTDLKPAIAIPDASGFDRAEEFNKQQQIDPRYHDLKTQKGQADFFNNLLEGFAKAASGQYHKPAPEKETIPEAGTQSFLVTHQQTKKYTVIGADNIHHALNKATKLFGDNWWSVNPIENKTIWQSQGYKFLPVRKFNQLIALLSSQ